MARQRNQLAICLQMNPFTGTFPHSIQRTFEMFKHLTTIALAAIAVTLVPSSVSLAEDFKLNPKGTNFEASEPSGFQGGVSTLLFSPEAGDDTQEVYYPYRSNYGYRYNYGYNNYRYNYGYNNYYRYNNFYRYNYGYNNFYRYNYGYNNFYRYNYGYNNFYRYNYGYNNYYRNRNYYSIYGGYRGISADHSDFEDDTMLVCDRPSTSYIREVRVLVPRVESCPIVEVAPRVERYSEPLPVIPPSVETPKAVPQTIPLIPKSTLNGQSNYPYDGGPTNPVPMPRPETQVPVVPSTNDSIPTEGFPVSLTVPAKKKYSYSAYGEDKK
jgi:hypothetical protein